MRAACEEFSSFENKIPFLRLGSNHANKVLTYYSEWSEGTEGTWSSYISFIVLETATEQKRLSDYNASEFCLIS
ncbi:unnamed protein product [Brassica oleracea var. botrytis]|uniref:Uncharacterized protein n=1 Tax=Brassica oleracea TaxID=3712 RepID=A0A3P6F2G2_BRAOL|nr:unnamed protein product [Brassica oleracea]